MGELPVRVWLLVTLGLTGNEVVRITGLEGDLKPLSLVPCTIRYADGTEKTIQIKCRIDTAIEIEYVENGGVLHYVLRDLAAHGVAVTDLAPAAFQPPLSTVLVTEATGERAVVSRAVIGSSLRQEGGAW